jgi:hypothetical protein
MCFLLIGSFVISIVIVEWLFPLWETQAKQQVKWEM